MIVSNYAKKGGVGKTTITANLGHFFATMGKRTLIVSLDDQNTIFSAFGEKNVVYSEELLDLEYGIGNFKNLDDKEKEELFDKIVYTDVRENLDLIKTNNGTTLQNNFTTSGAYEKRFKKLMSFLYSKYDVLIFDYPPSGSRMTEIVLDLTKTINIIVGLEKFDTDGFKDVIQYFNDCDLKIEKIKNVIPNGFMKNRKAPRESMKILKEEVARFLPTAKLITPLKEQALIKNLQLYGLTAFDEPTGDVSPYDKKKMKNLRSEFEKLFDELYIN